MPCGHLPPKVAKRPGGVNRNKRWARPAPAAMIEVADLRALQTSWKVFVSSLRRPPGKGGRPLLYAPLSGKVNRNVAPRPSSLLTEMLTPWRRAISAAMASPRPVPSREPSPERWKRSKISGSSASGMPGALVAHADDAALQPQAHAAAGRGELDGVFGHGHEHLPQAGVIARDPGTGRGLLAAQAQALGRAQGAGAHGTSPSSSERSTGFCSSAKSSLCSRESSRRSRMRRWSHRLSPSIWA